VRTTKEKKPISISRINLLFFIVFLLFAGVVFRLAYVQLVEGEKYKSLAASNRTKTIPYTAPRGLIKDANHEVLVNNKTVWTVTFQIQEEREQAFEKIADVLTELFAEPEDDKKEIKDEVLKSMDIGPRYRASKYIPRVIKVDVDETVRAYIEEHKKDLPGVEVIPDQMRNYMYHDFMAQVIGYTRSIPDKELDYYQALGYKLTDRVGRYGLEKQYESILHGKDGEYIVEVNSDYERVAQKAFTSPVPGNNLILTIDRRFQAAVEQALEEQITEIKNRDYKPMEDAEKGMVVVLNPKTGAVLAMANYPRFDLNWYNGTISQELYMNHIMPYETNSAIRGRYPVGSTAKPLTVLMGLEENIIDENTVINDTGRLLYDRNANGAPIYMRNYGYHVYGPLTLQKALQKSSNIFMAKIALDMRQKFGIKETMEKMRNYDQMFGLGQKTGIDLPEELSGQISSAMNYVQHAIGQHDTFTAMQLAQYVSTIANNGYRMQPFLVQAVEEGSVTGASGKILYKKEPTVLNKVEVSQEHLKAVQEGMYMVTQPGGTAHYALKDLPIKVAAKTGSAQSGIRDKDDHAVFIGYAPYEEPEIAFAIIVPYGGTGGSSAGPIARQIIESYLEIYYGEKKEGK